MDPKEKKILIVEDNTFFAKMIEDTLKKEGYQISMASHGREGLEKMVAEKPDLVILDLIMPVMDGFATLKEMKANETTKNIPVIVFTVRTGPEDIARVLEAGGTDYLIKADYSMGKLLEEVRKKLEEVS